MKITLLTFQAGQKIVPTMLVMEVIFALSLLPFACLLWVICEHQFDVLMLPFAFLLCVQFIILETLVVYARCIEPKLAKALFCSETC